MMVMITLMDIRIRRWKDLCNQLEYATREYNESDAVAERNYWSRYRQSLKDELAAFDFYAPITADEALEIGRPE